MQTVSTIGLVGKCLADHVAVHESLPGPSLHLVQRSETSVIGGEADSPLIASKRRK